MEYQWPYENEYGQTEIVESDVLVLGGGLAGCFAAIYSSEKRQKGQSLRKNFSMLAVGAGFSSGDFKTLRGDRACKALSLGEVAAAVRLRIAGFGEGTPQQDSDGTE